MGIGGGKSGGSSKTTTTSPSAMKLAKIAEQFVGETEDVRLGLLNAMEEVLSTGGSTIPIISRAVESSRRAGSVALKDTEDRLALTGLAGTPAGESIRAETRLESEINAGQTQESLAQNIFGMISNFVLGQSQTATAGLAGAIPGNISTSEKAKGKSMGVSK